MIAVDTRKLRDSGVGAYLTNVLPLVLSALPSIQFTFIGNTQDSLLMKWHREFECQLTPYTRRPYDPREQFELPHRIPKNTKLLWSPFINIPLLYRGKLLVTVYDTNFLALPQLLSQPQRLYAQFMFRGIRHKAAHILTISEFTKGEYLRLVGGEDKLTITYLAAASHWFQPVHAVKPRLNPYLLFVGNVKPHKNLSRLLAAFSQIKDHVMHDLIIVGRKEGFIVGDQNVLSAHPEIAHRVHFTGYVDDNELRSYVAHAEALVFPSLYEGFGLPPLEAMACGCPTIVSNTTSLPEVCGDAALYCDPLSVDDIAQKMLRIVSEPALRADLIARGKQHAARFTWEACAEKTIAVIENLLK